ncbi:MAG: AAA family ATPase [Deltaproteobacteria bacterium]|jgi:dCMP deaminase|nr:AAA family ATPase [Deltaproteobacteria bacterium]
MIIGITGKNGSGKGEAARFLVDSGYEYFSLSDVLRDELLARKKETSRENLLAIGNELRKAHGAGVLAEKILQKVRIDAHAVVDSIRNPFEVEVLRRRKDFHLLSIEAEPEARFKRTLSRNRDGDPKTYDQFLDVERREAKTPDPTTQQMDRTAEMSDAVVCNNGTVEELYEQIRQVVQAMAADQGRPDWDEYFMNIASVVALRGNCIKRKVAAVIVKDKRIISTGYNGTPRGITNCNEGGCARCNHFGQSGESLGECLCSHAEENSIVQAAYHGVSIKDSTIYTTYSPCLICTKMIINSGISEVVYSKAYSIEDLPLKLLREAGIKARQIEISDQV